jgi:hypothetical protein
VRWIPTHSIPGGIIRFCGGPGEPRAACYAFATEAP